jgi:hypothetical protein
MPFRNYAHEIRTKTLAVESMLLAFYFILIKIPYKFVGMQNKKEKPLGM